MNKKISPLMAVGIIIIVTGITAAVIFSLADKKNFWKTYELKSMSSVPMFSNCSKEVKKCPDGSTVSRVGSDCAFAQCPETNKYIHLNDCVNQGGKSTDSLKNNGNCPENQTNLGIIDNVNTPLICCKQNIVGNDSDEHGCIGSAGYQWCEEKQKCLRNWEESCSVKIEDENIMNSQNCVKQGGKIYSLSISRLPDGTGGGHTDFCHCPDGSDINWNENKKCQ